MLRKEKLKIHRYAKLRGIDEKSAELAYETASPQVKNEYHSEMDLYFKAIKDKEIKKGQSILHIYDPAPKGNSSVSN